MTGSVYWLVITPIWLGSIILYKTPTRVFFIAQIGPISWPTVDVHPSNASGGCEAFAEPCHPPSSVAATWTGWHRVATPEIERKYPKKNICFALINGLSFFPFVVLNGYFGYLCQFFFGGYTQWSSKALSFSDGNFSGASCEKPGRGSIKRQSMVSLAVRVIKKKHYPSGKTNKFINLIKSIYASNASSNWVMKILTPHTKKTMQFMHGWFS